MTLSEAKAQYIKTAFLCHSHRDHELAKGLVAALAQQGISLYVDWADDSMPSTPNRTTAEKIQDKIASCDRFLFLATRSSMESKWCPWEIGYADGKGPKSKIVIIPTSDASGSHGNEYLQLYRRLDGSPGALEVFEASSNMGRSASAL
jgi:hypothetical protein